MENAYRFSRYDVDHPLASCSPHLILLEEKNWVTCEHYVQSKIMRSKSHADKIETFANGEEAVRFARPWYRFKINNYQQLSPTLMTRALYNKVQMYEDVRNALLETRDNLIIETSQYDYFWGIGRDLRGHNHLGKIWMKIRDKINNS
jgi:ribA/ribD-fused uncharacterized protein